RGVMTPADRRQALPLFEEFVARFAPLLGDDSRPERARASLRGLLLDNDDNKTAEAIALKVYAEPSQGRMMQVFLGQPPWEVAPRGGDWPRRVEANPGRDAGGLIFGENSFPKWGTKSVGAAPESCAGGGRCANRRVAVSAPPPRDAAHTPLDPRLYLH